MDKHTHGQIQTYSTNINLVTKFHKGRHQNLLSIFIWNLFELRGGGSTKLSNLSLSLTQLVTPSVTFNSKNKTVQTELVWSLTDIYYMFLFLSFIYCLAAG